MRRNNADLWVILTCRQTYIPHQLNPELQSLTTPKTVSNMEQWTSTQVRPIPRSDEPPQIKPRSTEPNYTKAVSDIACTYTQVRCTPLPIKPRATEPNYTTAISNMAQCTSTKVIQSLTTPKQFLIWHNAHLPRSGRYPGQTYPLQIKPTATEPDYIKAVSICYNAHIPRSDIYPGQMYTPCQ